MVHGKDNATEARPARPWLEAVAWMALAWLLLYHGALLGRLWLAGDNGTQNFPWHAWVASLGGERGAYTPVPEMALGYPLWVEPQVGLYYPLNTARLPLDPYVSFTLKLVLHLVLVMAGMVLLARRQGLSPRGAALAALTVGCSQFAVLRLTQAPVLVPFAWLPWVVWAFATACERRDPRCLAAAVGLHAVQFLAGQPQMMLPTGLLCVVVGAASAPGGWRSRLVWAIGGYGLCAGAVLAMGLVVWMPALAHVATSERLGASSVAFVTQFGGNLREAMVNLVGGLRIALPIEQSAFCGTAAVLALAWAATQRRRRWLLWLGLAVLGLLLCWAVGNPLYEIIARLPVLNRFRGPGRYGVLYVVAVALLLGRLHDELPSLTSAARRQVAIGACVILALAVGLSQMGSPAPALAGLPLVVVVLLGAMAAVAVDWRARAEWAQRLLVALVMLELAAVGLPANRMVTRAQWDAEPEARMYQITAEQQRRHPGAVVFLGRIATDRSLLTGVPQATCFAGLWLPGLEFAHSLLSSFARREALAAWGVAWAWLPAEQARARAWPVTATVGDQALVEIPGPTPRAYAPARLLPLDQQSLALTLGAPDARPDQVTAVPPRLMPPDYRPGPTRLTVLRDEPRRLTLRVESEGGTTAVAIRCWAAGWRATVDGQPAPVDVVNQYLIGAPVPAGTHEVDFVYAPDIDVEARASLLSWLVWLGLSLRALLARRARREDDQAS